MRGLLLAAIAAPLFLLAISSAPAQQRERYPARVFPPTIENVAGQPIVRFRPRSDRERRRVLGALRVPNVTLMSGEQQSFALTPRNPLIAGRGALSTERTGFAPTFDTTGLHSARGFQSGLTFHIINLNNNRLLVDCAVSYADGVPFAMWVSDMDASGVGDQQSVAQNGRISFVTHVIAHEVFVHIGPVSHSIPNTQVWLFTGCEFTTLPAT
jgi:hypothetical protein